MTTDTVRKPPTYLCKEAARFWRDVADGYCLAPWQYSVLATAADAKHRECAAQKLLDKEGMTISTGQGMIRQHPAATVLRDSRSAFLRACRDLQLEVDEQ